MLQIRRDKFKPVLLSSPPLVVTSEQGDAIREILSVASSDSKFADKAYQAIWFVLTSGVVKKPVINSLNPTSGVIGSGSVQLTVSGAEFTTASQVVFGGDVIPTTYTNATTLTANVPMPGGGSSRDIPVLVFNEDTGAISEPKMFAVTIPLHRAEEKEKK